MEMCIRDRLKERLEVVKINDIKYLPCKIEIDNHFDDTCINDKITYLRLSLIHI